MRKPNHFIDQERDQIVHTCKTLHKLAEPSWQEVKTSSYIKSKLESAGFTVKTFEGHYGLIADLKGKSSDVIALRADMDALVQEVDGVVQANHSCGHDAHSTMVLYTALALAQSGYLFNSTLRFIFQPAEEMAGGALQMMEDGALNSVKFLAGIHLRPTVELPYGKAAPVIIHSSTATINGTIKGTQAHAARPHDGNNPIEAAAALITELKSIRLKTDAPFSIKITKLHAGEASNAIPETARFTLDLRADHNLAMEELIEQSKAVINHTAKLTSTKISFKVEEFLPAASLNKQAVSLAETAITEILGQENCIPVCKSPGAEDFHFYTFKNPNITATMIGLGCGLSPGLHHPKMNFNHEALIFGTQILTELLLNADGKSD
ncbi:amidohydrolase [Mesobacillus harenae]|uniref:amidohydrolase n=1 Tax=Mesobacillus harenae TaxID=2213203 RepID=UPI0015812890|nr:amidohydrolase [Mesobacillus harenae]